MFVFCIAINLCLFLCATFIYFILSLVRFSYYYEYEDIEIITFDVTWTPVAIINHLQRKLSGHWG